MDNQQESNGTVFRNQSIIDKLNEAFLPKNVECDGIVCMGCWKDVVRAAIKMLEEVPSPKALEDEKSIKLMEEYAQQFSEQAEKEKEELRAENDKLKLSIKDHFETIPKAFKDATIQSLETQLSEQLEERTKSELEWSNKKLKWEKELEEVKESEANIIVKQRTET